MVYFPRYIEVILILTPMYGFSNRLMCILYHRVPIYIYMIIIYVCVFTIAHICIHIGVHVYIYILLYSCYVQCRHRVYIYKYTNTRIVCIYIIYAIIMLWYVCLLRILLIERQVVFWSVFFLMQFHHGQFDAGWFRSCAASQHTSFGGGPWGQKTLMILHARWAPTSYIRMEL